MLRFEVVKLITRRSSVLIRPPLPKETAGQMPYSVSGLFALSEGLSNILLTPRQRNRVRYSGLWMTSSNLGGMIGTTKKRPVAIDAGPVASEYDPDAQAVVFKGDNLLFIASLPAGSVDLVVTSPPYNIGKSYETRTGLGREVCGKPGGMMVIRGGTVIGM